MTCSDAGFHNFVSRLTARSNSTGRWRILIPAITELLSPATPRWLASQKRPARPLLGISLLICLLSFCYLRPRPVSKQGPARVMKERTNFAGNHRWRFRGARRPCPSVRLATREPEVRRAPVEEMNRRRITAAPSDVSRWRDVFLGALPLKSVASSLRVRWEGHDSHDRRDVFLPSWSFLLAAFHSSTLDTKTARRQYYLRRNSPEYVNRRDAPKLSGLRKLILFAGKMLHWCSDEGRSAIARHFRAGTIRLVSWVAPEIPRTACWQIYSWRKNVDFASKGAAFCSNQMGELTETNKTRKKLID